MRTIERFKGCLLGLACGDAVGTSLEFQPRGSFRPLADMVGGGPFNLQPGQWTDDTSMALCLATSLVECRGFDACDQMRRYCSWQDQGYLSSNGVCFDIGTTVAQALARFRRTGEPLSGSHDPHTAGNGSIMRLAPVVMYYHPDRDAAVAQAALSSETTHAAAECLDACRLLAAILCDLLDGCDKRAALQQEHFDVPLTDKIAAIARGAYRDKAGHQIRGSGYVVASLEAALWCFWQTGSFEAAVLAAANLGDDADTTAAICGQLAGACYGLPGIPQRWRDRIVMRDEILDLSERLFAAGE